MLTVNPSKLCCVVVFNTDVHEFAFKDEWDAFIYRLQVNIYEYGVVYF